MNIDRRAAFKVATGGVLYACGLGVEGCTDGRAEWMGLPPLQRIARLETKNYPKFRDFLWHIEMTNAVAEVYCSSNVPCNKNADYLKQNVFFVNQQDFVAAVEASQGKVLEPEAEKLKRGIEFVTWDDKVYVNWIRVESDLKALKKEQPHLEQQLGPNTDPAAVVLKCLLFHAFSHVQQSEQEFRFNPPIEIRGGPTASLNQFRRFSFQGVDKDGNIFFLDGSGEVMTELNSYYVSQITGSGQYLTPTPDYSYGAHLLKELNDKTGVLPQEFIEYFPGRRNLIELFARWARFKDPKLPALGMEALALAGLTVTDSSQQIKDNRAKQLLESLNLK